MNMMDEYDCCKCSKNLPRNTMGIRTWYDFGSFPIYFTMLDLHPLTTILERQVLPGRMVIKSSNINSS